MKTFEVKDMTGGVLDVSSESRKVKVAISHTGSKDLDGDVIDKKAFNETIKQRGPKGSNMIWHLTDHNPSLKHAVGKFSELYMEGDYLVGVTEIPNTSWGNDVMAFYNAGTINQHSIGFRTIKQEPVNAGSPNEYRLIKEILLYEGSAVLWAANPNTPTLSVGKSLTLEERKSEFNSAMEELSKFHKLFKSGHLTDTTFELIEIKINQLKEKIQLLFDQPTGEVADTPVDETVNSKWLDVFEKFNNKFKQ